MKLSFLLLIILSVCLASFNSCDKVQKQETNGTALLEDTVFYKSLDHFLFVGKWYAKNGIYKYSFDTKKYETVWWNPRENVNLLVTKLEDKSIRTSSRRDKPAFFLTGGRMGVKGNFPFFERIKIYRISGDLSNTENIYKIESGMQINSHWNDDGNLEVVFTSIDKTDPSYINKHKKTFDNYGKLIDDEIETFNLVVDGFPELLPKRDPTVSPSGKYGISILGDSVFLKTANIDSLELITAIKNKLNKVSWSDDEEFLFISTLDLKNETVKTRNPETSELYIYSINRDSVIVSWQGAGVKNFFTFDSLIFFDDGFGKNSSVNIYNYVKEELIDKIQMKGECGLFYIPKL